MKEYVLNETPVRTSVNYNINNIKVDLDIPELKGFENISITTSELDKINIDIDTIQKAFSSRIGLEFDSYESVNISVPEDTIIQEPIVLDYLFDEDNNCLVDNIKITMNKNSKASFILHYCNDIEENCFHCLKQETILKENSSASIVIANMLSDESNSFIAVENDIGKDACLNHTMIELGGKNKISNYNSKLTGDNSENVIKSIYLGTNNDVIDINYNIETIGKNSKCNIESQGAITDKAKKNFKGIIDFKKGSCKSVGTENENCMILSDKAKSKSMPVLLCHEEDVNGEHGVSSGKLDENKLFYIMTKGISYDEAKKLIVKANFSEIIRDIPNTDLQQEINGVIDSSI